MSIWQFKAAVDGFAKKQNASKTQISESEANELWEWIADAGAVEVKAPMRQFNPYGAFPVEMWP